jgi:hypothetical protein
MVTSLTKLALLGAHFELAVQRKELGEGDKGVPVSGRAVEEDDALGP